MAGPDSLDALLTLRRGAGGRVGAERIALLEAIGEAGTISAAGRRLGLSYKAAWDAVQALNNLFDRPLVVSHAGGRSGGGAEVTEAGRAVIRDFRALEAELAAAAERLGRRAGGEAGPLLWSVAMKTSARNALKGRVVRLVPGAVNAEVILGVADGVEIVAVVTLESVRDLGLAPGADAVALIKSSMVVLAAGHDGPPTSARNALKGEVARREDGAVNAEIAVRLAEGKTLTAVVTLASAEALDLKPGDPVTALVKASHVILAVA